MEKTYIYSYRLTYFGGTAPCYDNGILTLAICKRDMRRVIAKRKLSEKNSDIWFVGIVGNELGAKQGFNKDQVLYIAKLKYVIPFSEYFTKENNRKDNIYIKTDTDEKTELKSYNNKSKCYDYFKHKETDVHKEIELQLRDFDVAHKIPIKYVLVSDEYSFINKDQSNEIIEIVRNNESKWKNGTKNKWAKGVGHCWFEDYDGVLAKEFENIVSSNKEHNISVLPYPYCNKDNKNCGGCGSQKEGAV